jgi:TolB protein
LTHTEAENWYPAWSPEGLEIAAEDGMGLLIVTVANGAHRRLTDHGSDVFPDWSPDGNWVAFTSMRSGDQSLWQVSATGGEPELLTEREGRLPRWSPDGRWIYFLGEGECKDTVWALSITGREVRPVTALTGRSGEMGRSGLATDGQFVYFTWEESRGDLWVADFVREQGG